MALLREQLRGYNGVEKRGARRWILEITCCAALLKLDVQEQNRDRFF